MTKADVTIPTARPSRSAKLPGLLLKSERIRQNKGQKEVCHGICVPSYLSKIEHGSVCPDRKILSELFGRLGICYEEDAAKLSCCQKLIENYFYRLQYELDTKTVYGELKAEDEKLRCSEYAVDWLLVRAFEQEDVISFLEELEEHMEPKQHAYYQLLRSLSVEDVAEKVLLCKEACDVLHHSYAMNFLCDAYLLAGNYSAIHAMEQRIVAAAVGEGNTFQLADFFFLNGSAYACLNMEEMMMLYYERGIRLLQNTGWQNRLAMLYYNIGATYISLKKYDLALQYLKMAEDHGEASFDILQKKAIVLIRMGRKEEAAEFLEKLRETLFNRKEAESPSVDMLKYEEAVMECEDGFLENPEYLELLEKLIRAIRKERHFGHLYFYRDVIMEACKRQRKYKKALEFQNEISGNVIKNSF